MMICGEQVQPGDAAMLPLDGADTDFTLATDTQRILESVVGRAFDLAERPRECLKCGR